MDRDTKLNTLAAFLVFLLVCLWAWLSSCTSIQKFLFNQKEATDSTTRTKTERIETSQKDLEVVGGVSIGFDTGCLNKVSYNVGTGQIEASGGVRGVSVQHEKKEAVKDAKSDKSESETILQQKKVEIKKHTEIKPKWWVKWLYIAIGAISMLAWHHRKYLIKLILPVFNPLTQLLTPKK